MRIAHTTEDSKGNLRSDIIGEGTAISRASDNTVVVTTLAGEIEGYSALLDLDDLHVIVNLFNGAEWYGIVTGQGIGS